jgi:hypothetical protein
VVVTTDCEEEEEEENCRESSGGGRVDHGGRSCRKLRFVQQLVVVVVAVELVPAVVRHLHACTDGDTTPVQQPIAEEQELHL